MSCDIPWKRRVVVIILSSVRFTDLPRSAIFLGQCCTKLKSGLLKYAPAFKDDSSVDETGGALPWRGCLSVESCSLVDYT